MKTIQIYNKSEEHLKTGGFKTIFSWGFAKGYSDTQGMFPILTASKGNKTVQIMFDHSPNKTVTLFAGNPKESKPKYTIDYKMNGDYEKTFLENLLSLIKEWDI